MTAETTIDLNNSSRDELLTHARDDLGLKVPGNISKADLQQLIAAQTGDVVDSAQRPDATQEQLAAMKEIRKQKTVRIRVFENPKHKGRVPVSVNGIEFTIKPGAEVEVPECVVEVLRNAVATEYSQMTGDDGSIRTVASQSQQFPFEVLRA